MKSHTIHTPASGRWIMENSIGDRGSCRSRRAAEFGTRWSVWCGSRHGFAWFWVSGLKRKASQSIRSTVEKQPNVLRVASNQRSVKQPIVCGIFWVCDVDQSKSKKGLGPISVKKKLNKRDNFIPWQSYTMSCAELKDLHLEHVPPCLFTKKPLTRAFVQRNKNLTAHH